MSNVINWFRIKFDRKTHDAKFQIFSGNSHQEINLQVQAELNRATRKYDETKNKFDELVISSQEQTKKYNDLKEQHDALGEENGWLRLCISKLEDEVSTEKQQKHINCAALDSTNAEYAHILKENAQLRTKCNLISSYAEALETTNTIREHLVDEKAQLIKLNDSLSNEVALLKKRLETQADTMYGSYFHIQHPACSVARLELRYSEHRSLLEAHNKTGPFNDRRSVYSVLATNDEQTIREMVISLVKRCFCGN